MSATDSSDKSIFAGKAFTGFSNLEEEQVDKVKEIPFLLEDAISKQGGIYEKASQPWAVSLYPAREPDVADGAHCSPTLLYPVTSSRGRTLRRLKAWERLFCKP